jgi:arylsulfatase A-like enzyme
VADAQFGRLISWLKDSGRDSDSTVLVAADHRYCTVIDDIPVVQLLQEAGFPKGAGPGEVIVASNGGSMLYYVGGRDARTADRLATWLMEQPWSGAMVASDALGQIDGTLPASVVGVEGPRAPDIAMSLGWNSSPNDAGYAGHHYNSGLVAGQGNHGSMSSHEQRCAFIMVGPKIKQGVVSSAPSSNVDVAPTILRLLGLDAPAGLDRRALDEALIGGSALDEVEWSSEIHVAERDLANGKYRQQIMISKVGDTTSIDEGSAAHA